MTKIILISTLFFSLTAAAFPLPKMQTTGLEMFASIPMPPTFTANYDFEGIVALSNCSGSIVRLENSGGGDLALVLTNGHCLEGEFARPGEFTFNKPVSRDFKVLNSSAQVLGTVSADLVVYSTMTGTDVTLYKLTQTYDQIKTAFSVRPLTISHSHPVVGTPINVVSGYWKRGYSCNVDGFANLKEGDWNFNDSIRYTQPGCEIIGGTSGSPVIETGTRTIVGVNNTSNEDGTQCEINNPCEIDVQGNVVSAKKGDSYAQETFWIYSCLNNQNQLDLTVPGCKLQH